MSKHIDLIAVGALLLASALAPRVQLAIHTGQGPLHLLSIHSLSPVVIAPPRVPAMPRLPHLHFPRA
jgi:hypothetical protein